MVRIQYSISWGGRKFINIPQILSALDIYRIFVGDRGLGKSVMVRPGGSVNGLGRPRERKRRFSNYDRRKATGGGNSVLLGTGCGGNPEGILGFRTKGKRLILDEEHKVWK